MANISFSINFTLPAHDTLTSQCVVFYVGAYKERECYNPNDSVNAIQSWSVFCSNFTTGASHTYSGIINTDTEIDGQCRIVLQVYAIPCCFLAPDIDGLSVINCGDVAYPPTPTSLLTNPGLSSFTSVINPNNLYSNCRRYILGLNGLTNPTITQIQYAVCQPPDVYYCSPNDFPQNVNPVNVLIPPVLQNSLLNTIVPNGSNINNCIYSNPEIDNLSIGQAYFPPYGVIKLCGQAGSPPVLYNGTNVLSNPSDYHQMINGNLSCDECCHKCRQYRVMLSLDNTCGGAPQFMAFQNCRENYRLTIIQIFPGQPYNICAVEGTITWLTPCLSTDGTVLYMGSCSYFYDNA